MKVDARRDVPRKAGDGCRTRRVSNSDRTPAPEARNQVVPTHFIKEETEIPGVQTVWLRHRRYFRHSKTREAPASCTPRRASRRERSQRRFARVVARLEPAGPTRTTPAPSRAPRIPQLAPRRSTTPPPPTDVRACRERGGARRRRRRRVSHGAVRTMDGTHRRRHHHRSVSVFRRPGRARTGARAPPLLGCLAGKKYPFTILAGIRQRRKTRPQTAANPRFSCQLAAFAPGYSALLVKVSRPTPLPAPSPDPPLLTSHPPSPEPPRSRLDAPTSTTTYPTIAKTPIRCGGSWRSRCGRWP